MNKNKITPESINVTTLEPGDIIILKFPEMKMPRDKQLKYIKASVDQFKRFFPHNDMVALTHGHDMEIIKQWP
jgi:hypothetical protein